MLLVWYIFSEIPSAWENKGTLLKYGDWNLKITGYAWMRMNFQSKSTHHLFALLLFLDETLSYWI